jgi:hypothetical protein
VTVCGGPKPNAFGLVHAEPRREWYFKRRDFWRNA